VSARTDFGIRIDPDIARRDGIDVERLVAFYAARGTPITIGKAARTKTEKTCRRCERLLPIESFARFADHVDHYGNARKANRMRECLDCVDAARAEARERKRAHGRKPRTGNTPAENVSAPGTPDDLDLTPCVTCETCGKGTTVDDTRRSDGAPSGSCSECRGDCFRPPYGWKTCPGCNSQRHQSKFRSGIDGKVRKGRPFVDCVSCRRKAASTDPRCGVCAGTGKRFRK
jgi:hypothetical protein